MTTAKGLRYMKRICQETKQEVGTAEKKLLLLGTAFAALLFSPYKLLQHGP